MMGKITFYLKRFSDPSTLKRALIICGIASSFLYICADIVASIQWEEYSYTSRSVSELMAIEAPTRPFLIFFFSIYNVLIIAFGWGVCCVNQQTRNLKVTGLILILYGVIGIFGLYFFPMHLPGIEQEMTLTDTMHLVTTGVIVLLIFLSIGFASTVKVKWFRIFSFTIIPLLLLFGILAGMDGAKIAAQLPTPWLGIKERVNIYGYLIWIIVFSSVMLRINRQTEAINGSTFF